MSPPFSAEEIARELRGGWGRDARVLDEIDSTNLEALRWMADGGPEGALVVAGHQRAGRGRRGRAWLGDEGRSLMFSVILRPSMDPAALGLLTLAFGLGCVRGIESSTGLTPVLKWPNDVLIEGRKVAGILMETRMHAHRLEGAVVGVGVNTSWESREIPEAISDRATSLAVEGATPLCVELLAAILFDMERSYDAVRRGEGASTLTEVKRRMPMLGGPVAISDAAGESLRGIAIDLAPDGALVVEAEGVSTAVYAGDVETVRPGRP